MNIAKIIDLKYPEADLTPLTGNVEVRFMPDDSGGVWEITKWELDAAKPVIVELVAWAEQNKDLILEPLRKSARERAEQVFYQLAEQITGETINPLVVQEWQEKEQLAKAWIAAGKPEPTADNEFSLAYYEAQGDPNKTPSQLMEVWVERATQWRQMNIAYIAWRQGFRARLKAAQSEGEIAALAGNVEAELKELFGIQAK